MKFISLIILLLILISLGLVFARNFWGEKDLSKILVLPGPSTPAPSPTEEPVAITTISPDWQVFKSKDESFRFRYPPGWQVSQKPASFSQEGPKNLLGVIVQAWVLTNFRFSQTEEEKSLPENSIKIDFEISTEGRKESMDSLLDCSGRDSSQCQDLTINGVSYRRLVSTGPTGKEEIRLVTIKDNKIYKITSTAVLGKDKEKRKEIERIMGTFEIMESS